MGVAPALGVSCTLSVPLAPMVAEVLPLGIMSPLPVVKAGQLMRIGASSDGAVGVVDDV